MDTDDNDGWIIHHLRSGVGESSGGKHLSCCLASRPAIFHTGRESYDDLGNQTYLANPNSEVTTDVYNAASERISTTDSLGKMSNFTYDLASRPVRTTDPLGRYTENSYDLAGRKIIEKNYSPSGDLLTTTSFSYDPAGNQISVTSPRGFATTFSYDAASRLTQVVEPVEASTSITSSFGYDAMGNLTRTTDGEGRTTVATYQPWNLLEKTIEPSTTAHPALSDRTFTNLYDSGGLLTEERHPGGVAIARIFDELGRLRTESGSGGGAASATRNFSYDLASLRTSVSHPSGTQSFSYDDRRLPTASSGPAGASTYTYDPCGRPVSKTDPAGTHNFTWTSRSELDTATEPLTGITFDYSFDDASQVTEVKYGTAACVPKRTYSYGDLGRLTSDTLKDSSNATTASQTYGYDSDGNLISQNIELPGNSQSGAHYYSYDRAGRITSWIHPSLSGPVTVPVGWDKAGNRTLFGADTYLYDQRNRLTTSTEQVGGIIPVTTTRSFTYAPRGTLSQVTDGTTTSSYTFDALSRLTNYTDALSNIAYSYDSLDRIATRGSSSFTYDGWEIDPTSDGTFTYSRSPSGRLMALAKGADEFLAGANRHGDLTHLFDTAASLTDTRLYDPFGKEIAETGLTNPSLGFQSDFTDPASGKVWMGARWYGPNEAQFLSRDSVSGQLRTPISLNRYTYAFADPLNYFDPDGHWPKFVDNFFKGAKQGAAKAYRGAKSAVTNVGRGFKTAASAVTETIKIQASRMQHKAEKAIAKVERTTSKVASGMRRLGSRVASIAKDVGETAGGVGEGAANLGKNLAALVRHPIRSAKALGQQMSTAYREGGGGLMGILSAANQLNPVYHMLVAGEAWINASNQGNLREAGRHGFDAAFNLVSTVALAAGGAEADTGRVGAAEGAAGTLGGEAGAAKLGSSRADFIAGPPGSRPPVPLSQSRMAAGFDNARFHRVELQRGMDYTLPDGGHVRLMESTQFAPRRASFTNEYGGPVDPFTGKTLQPPRGISRQQRLEYVRSRTHVEQYE